MSRSRGKGRVAQTSLFITKLQEMVENTQIEDTISWTSTADSFHIKNISRFTEEVLPRYFKHRNFSSFIRQLNMYGFRKIRHPDGENVYLHEYFKQGAKQLHRNITRKIREDREDRLALYDSVGREQITKKDIQEVKLKQKNLEQMCRHLVMQNQKLMEENHSLVKKLQEDSKEKERRLEEFLILLLSHKNRALTSQTTPTLTNSQFKYPSNAASPLEIIANNLEGTQQMRKLRDAIDNTYFKSNNHKLNEQTWEKEKIEAPADQEDNSFMSVNDFINADDYDLAMHLQDSR